MILIWALGINGEGSSVVVSEFISALFAHPQLRPLTIVCSRRSTLSERVYSLQSFPKHQNSRLIRLIFLPKFFRSYPIHFALKLFLPVQFFYRAVITFDDFPFFLAKKQLLYFHQPNLIFNIALIWRIKRLAFKLLLNRNIVIYFQTNHIRKAFFSNFHYPFIASICFLHKI